MSTYVSVAHQRRLESPLNLEGFKALTGFDSPRQFSSYLSQLASDNAASGMECTADDYRIMARVVAALPVVDTRSNWERVGEHKIPAASLA